MVYTVVFETVAKILGLKIMKAEGILIRVITVKLSYETIKGDFSSK